MLRSWAIFLSTAILFISLGFEAAAAPAPARLDLGQDYRFVVISDCRSGDRIYSKIVKALMRREPEFVVFVGDILPTMCDEVQWASFKRISSPITVPYYLTPGNHDIEDAKSDCFWADHVELPGNERYYEFTVGDDLFVVLNSADYRNDRRITGEQLAWLRRTLDPEKYEHQFVFVHHPLYVWKGAFHENECLDRHPAERDALHRLFVEKGVDVVFHGHQHGYRRMDKDGVRYMIVAGAGSPLYDPFHHFVVVDVKGSYFSTKVIDKEGYLRDEFTMGRLPKSGSVSGR